jgi:hypothetical protein
LFQRRVRLSTKSGEENQLISKKNLGDLLSWHQIIRAKYPGASDIFASSAHGGSPFWRSLHKIKDFFKLGAQYSSGNGQRIRFLTDCWLERAPLCERFQRLFQISSDPDCLIAQVHQSGRWHISFRRTFGQPKRESWTELQDELRSILLSDFTNNVS